MKVWVIMGNDYPDAVFSSEAAAQVYCKQKKDINVYDVERGEGRMIHWRAYEFIVDNFHGSTIR